MTFYLLRDIAQVSEELWKFVENNCNSNDMVLFMNASRDNENTLDIYMGQQGDALSKMGDMLPFLPTIVPWFFEPYTHNYNMRMEILNFIQNRVHSTTRTSGECGGSSTEPEPDNDPAKNLGIQTLGRGGRLSVSLDVEALIKYYHEHPEELD